MSTILKIEHLTKKFRGLTAVNDLSIEMKSRTIHTLIGPNGSGKTTTINMINGVFPPTKGKIYFDGHDVTDLPTWRIARLGVCRTFQNLKLFNTMTVEENLMVGGQMTYADGNIFSFLLNPVKARKEEKLLEEKAHEAMKKLHIEDLAKRKTGGLPYGKLKMVELAKCMMGNPKLMLLDEPAAGLNPSERAEFLEILLQLYEEGMDLFLIEHNMDVVMRISQMITVINFGSKIAEGRPEEIQNHPEVIQAYLGDRYQDQGGNKRC